MLLLCSGPLPASGQCPAFQWNDFTKTLVQPNKDCNTAGSVSIRYSNNIVGVDDLRYQFGSGPNGPWFQEVDAPSPGATVKVDVPTSMDGKTLFVRITTQCGTSNRTDYWSMGRIDLRKSETVSLRTSSTPAGSGVGSSGGVQAWIDGPSNFTEATFNLYKRNDPNTVIAYATLDAPLRRRHVLQPAERRLHGDCHGQTGLYADHHGIELERRRLQIGRQT